MRILLTGTTGQVGSALYRTLPALGDVVATTHRDLDLAQTSAVRRMVREVNPNVIVNAAAYTAVDQAESEKARAFAVNRDGPAALAEEAKSCDALLVHFSTDYVFDGEKPSAYVETDEPNPLNVYGESKLAGEREIQQSGCHHLILRTSWVYARSGRNFLLTVMRQAREGRPLRVVVDQRGAPTSSSMIATATTEALPRVLADDTLEGLYHMTAGGSTTWYGFAQAAFEHAGVVASLTPIHSEDYPAMARRPRNSLLDSTKLARRLGLRLPTWDAGLRLIFQ